MAFKLTSSVAGLLALLAPGACNRDSPARDVAPLDDAATLRQRGADYALANCNACHAIAQDEERSPNPQAPSFIVIASTPGMTMMALNAALHTPHRSMPNLKVDEAAIEPLAAYITSLKDPALTRRLRDDANKAEKVRPLRGE